MWDLSLNIVYNCGALTLLETLTPWKLRVQRRATELVPKLAKLSYESRLRKFDIYSLYHRRRRGDLIETYELLKSYYNVDWSKFFTFSPVHYTRGHQLKLYKIPHTCSTSVEGQFLYTESCKWMEFPTTWCSPSMHLQFPHLKTS